MLLLNKTPSSILLVVIGLLISKGNIFAQQLTIKNQLTREPIENVMIFSKNKNLSLITDKQGKVAIDNLRNSTEIKIKRLGFELKTTSFKALEKQHFLVTLLPSNDIKEISISATKWKTNTKLIAKKIDFITSKDVLLTSPQTAADLLKNSPQVFIQKSQQGGGSPMIRGFATNRLLYTVDGIRMNNAIFRGGNIQNVISLDPLSIKNTEVYLGSNSVMYGSDAIGGVMSFSFLTPKFSKSDSMIESGSVLARLSSANNEKTAHFDFNIGFKKWAFLTAVSYNDFGDLTMGSNGPDSYLQNYQVSSKAANDIVSNNPNPKNQTPTGYKQINLLQKISFKPNNNWLFSYGFYFSKTSSYSRYDRLIQRVNNLPKYAQWDYGPQEWMMNLLSIRHERKSLFFDKLSLKIAHQYFQESRISRKFKTTKITNQLEKVHALSLNLDLTKGLAENLNLFYGLETVNNLVFSNGTTTATNSSSLTQSASRYPKSVWSSYSVYSLLNWKKSDVLSFSGGLRYNFNSLFSEFNSTFYPLPFKSSLLNNNATTGNLGLSINPAKNLWIKPSFSTAFRAPNVDDIGKIFDSKPGIVVVPNINVKPEYSYSAELNIKKQFSKLFTLYLSGYYTFLNDALVTQNSTFNNKEKIIYDGVLSQVQTITNASSMDIYGLSSSIDIFLSQYLTLKSSFNYQQGTQISKKVSSATRHTPPLFGNTSLNYSRKKIILKLSVDYSGEKSFQELALGERKKPHIYAKDASGNPYSPAWYTLNLNVLYTLTKSVALSGGIENITDQRYKTYSSGIAAAGINFILSAKVKF